MSKRSLLLACLVGAMALAAPASAQTITASEAEQALFGTRGTSIALSSQLSETDREIMRRTIDLLGDQLGGPVKYYAAIAYSPDEGLLSEALQSALNYHSPAAADRAAVAACNAARQSGTRSCQVAARVLPRGFEERGFSLSFDGTNAFRQTYRRAGSPKAMAVSESTGAFGIGATAAEAEAACARRDSGAGDCRTAIAD